MRARGNDPQAGELTLCSFYYSLALSKIYSTIHNLSKIFKKQVVSKSVPGRSISQNCCFSFISTAGSASVETEDYYSLLLLL